MEKYKMTLSKDFDKLFSTLEESSQVAAKDRSDVIRRAVANIPFWMLSRSAQ